MKGLYSSYDEALEFFYSAVALLPNYIRVEKIGETWEKREIVAVIITKDIATHSKKPALFYTGTIHAREWIGLELSLGFVEYIISNISYDPQIQSLLERTTIYMVPCANPDGFEYSRNHFNFWRKNRRQNADGSFGVDLNRNFSIGFEQNNNPNSNVYGGPEPFSEPETLALKEFVDTHSNITIAVDYHSQGNVFFPAHDFRHEDTIDTTDMNVLCANMAEAIKKVSQREYGIHQGKPPAKLISGSGREYYYSKGIIATVVEVGTRNISDYLEDMKEHINEQIQALLVAIEEVPTYCKSNILKRVSNFKTKVVTSSSVELSWEYEVEGDIYFEIYRSLKDKMFCNRLNRVGKTKNLSFIDTNLQSAKDYYYNIRIADATTKTKSPFSPQIHIKTDVDRDEFHRIYYATKTKTGYVSQFATDNKSHFGVNSLFVGVDDVKGISYSVVNFSLDTISSDAIIKSAVFKLYPINRVSTTIEKYGEWNVGLLDMQSEVDIYDYQSVQNASILQYIGRPTSSNQLTQGIWRHWQLSKYECSLLQKAVEKKEAFFRVEGPKELPLGRNSQMMQWDLGYGKFSQGLNYRPILEIVYTLKESKMDLYPKKIYSITQDTLEEDSINCGFDDGGKKIFSSLEYSLNSLPNFDYTMITKAHLELNSTRVYLKDDIRFHLEFIQESIDKDYDAIKQRSTIENIGYDVSANELQKQEKQYFIFDTFSLKWLVKYFKSSKEIAFLLRPTSQKKNIKNKIVSFVSKNPDFAPKFSISYINKRKKPLSNASNLRWVMENGVVKLLWDNPKDEDFVGIKVIKNPFRKPINPFDGQKLYGGKDSYTYDNFGSLDIKKYYAVFSYDDVPNYSEPLVIEYAPKDAKSR